MTAAPKPHAANNKHLSVAPDPHAQEAPSVTDGTTLLYLQGGMEVDEYTAAAAELEVSRINHYVARVRHQDATYAQARAVAYLEQADRTAAITVRRAAAAGHTMSAIADQLGVDETQVQQWITGTEPTPAVSSTN